MLARNAMTDVEQRVLYEVNEIRVRHGYQRLAALPKGTPSASTRCVIANALRDIDSNVSVGGSTYTLFGIQKKAPSSAWAKLVTTFDNHGMPHLEGHPELQYEKVLPKLPEIKEGFKRSGASLFARMFRGAPVFIEDKQDVMDAAKKLKKEKQSEVSEEMQKEVLAQAAEQQKFDHELQLAELATTRCMAEQKTLQMQAWAAEVEARLQEKQLDLEIAREQAIRAMAEQETQELALQQ